MAKGVYISNPKSIYDDKKAEFYHFPKMYLSRAQPTVGDWIIFYESGTAGGLRAYLAVAEVARIRADLNKADHYYADMVPGSYLEFAQPVTLKDATGRYHSQNIQKAPNKPNGVAQSAVQPLREEDFWKILRLGTQADDSLLMPRRDEDAPEPALELSDNQDSFDTPFVRERVEVFLTKAKRDQTFRARVLSAYGQRCALTDLGFFNGGGRAEVQGAHIKPVEHGGPDSVRNGLALSGTVHWMFDRGLLGLEDDGRIMVSRKVNDVDSLDRLLRPSRMMRQPEAARDRPDPDFLRWHRETVFER